MNCPTCGQKLPNTALRCWSCGRLITDSDGGSPTISRSPLVQLLAIVIVLSVALAGALVAVGRVDVGTAFATATPSPASPTPDSSVGVVAYSREPIPSDAPGLHTVRTGETLYGIAFVYDVDTDDLRYWNADAYPSLNSTPQLVVGWVLKVSGPPRPTPSPQPTPQPTPVLAGPTTPPQTGGGSSTSRLVPLPMLSISVPGASVVYFSIDGTNPNELFASAQANSGHPHGRKAAAYVAPTVDYDYDYTVDPTTGFCRVTTFTVSRSYQVTAPRWTSPAMVHPALLGWWGQVLDHIAWHEGQHVVIFERHFASIEARATAAPCGEVQGIIDAEIAFMNAAQDAFDREQQNWIPPSYSGPWDW